MKKASILLGITLLFQLSLFAQINPFTGAGRTSAVEFVIGNEVFVGLGYNDTIVFDDFWKYSQDTEEWTEISAFPGGDRYNAVAFTINGKGYVGLGQSSNNTYHNDFYCYDPVNQTWTTVESFGGVPTSLAVSFVIDNKAYVGTGTKMIEENVTYENTKDFWEYDPETNTWSQISTFEAGVRQNAAAFAIDGKGYVTGGVHYDDGTVTYSDVQEYDPATDTWVERIYADGLNLSFNGAEAFNFNGKGYICYGNNEEIVSYDPVSNNVENLGNMLNLDDNRDHPVAFVLNGTPYFGLGSYGFFENTYMDDILEIPFPTNPTDINLSSNEISENEPDNTQVGVFSTVDENSGVTHAYELTDNENYPDNNMFTIENDALLAQSMDFETNASLTIKVKSTNSLELSVVKEFTISILDVEELITDINLSSNTILENQIDGTYVGQLSSTDENSNVTHTYELVNNENYPDNENFSIDGSILLANTLDYEQDSVFVINIQSKNNLDVTYEKEFTINVLDDTTDNGTAITKIQSSDFRIFPNPATSQIRIQNKSNRVNISSIALIDVAGRTYNVNVKETINISTFEPGVYFLRLVTTEGIINKRIVIE
ncbi:N-acetylneuraminate epimerase precursor [Salinivirga cyanobacteriivorans]|uniref:N-acetylneuraminate epimerase n=1 Tax=Salinivirga cyanobacteriivorans TaxID=1307839 RepID=A0A0S2HVH3_9BACT|nr:T9SS type A sorting domain-containing protein [Salinivirga cyanobacteriivorans]ALO13948.1 N-acetylneuraminate epimerase precursor [Salinivirga cyanobacteriivorans]